MNYKALTLLAYWSAKGSNNGTPTKAYHLQILRELLQAADIRIPVEDVYEAWAVDVIAANYAVETA